MSYESYILIVYISCDKNTKFDVTRCSFCGAKNALKYVFSWGCTPDPTGEL